MFKIKTIKSIGLLLVTFTALLFINVKIVSAQEKSTLNRAVLLENTVELPGNNVNAKVIRVTFPPAFKTPWHTHEGPGPRYVCLLYTSPSPRDRTRSRMPSSA